MVTNITGFLIIRRTSSFLNASLRAGPVMLQSMSEGTLFVVEIMNSPERRVPAAEPSELIRPQNSGDQIDEQQQCNDAHDNG
jgi:hypothetical protein